MMNRTMTLGKHPCPLGLLFLY